MFRRINLYTELQKERDRIQHAEQQVLDEFKILLQEEEKRDAALQQRMQQSSLPDGDMILHNLNAENIFSLREIRNICTRFRLRFLETKHLRYPLPYEAFIRIKEFEKQQQVEVKQFSILAPAEAFRLDKKTDPLLFARLGNDRYYLLYRWGNDLSWTRKVLMFPLRNLYTLFATIILTSFVFAFFIPKEWIVYDESLYPMLYNFRLFLFFLLATGSFAAAVYISITRNKSLSEDAWNSKWL